MQGELYFDTLEWLWRSISGEMIKPLNFNLLVDRFFNEWLCIENVREMGACKTLVTFDLKDSLEEALAIGMDLLLTYFQDVGKWNKYVWCQTRRIWLECYGIPPHAWTKENIMKIGEEWGKVVCLDKITEEMKSLNVKRILIDTCIWQFISGWIYLSIGG